MVFKQKGKTAPLIEIIKTPQTETNSQLQRIPPLQKTALDIEDSSVLDLSVQNISSSSTSQLIIVAYIRPFTEELGELLNYGERKISYVFRGVSANDLRQKFIRVLEKEKIKPKTSQEIRADVFQYNYSIAERNIIYTLAGRLNKAYAL